MKQLAPENGPAPTLQGKTARDLMTPNPLAVPDSATVPEIMALFTDRGENAAAVIDGAGRPVGVVSRTDLLIHEREKLGKPLPGVANPASVPGDVALKESMN